MEEYERFKQAHIALLRLREKHPDVFDDLDTAIAEYNVAMTAVVNVLRTQGRKQSVGPFSAYLQGGTALDLASLTEHFPTLILEPGVVTGVDAEKLRDVAVRRGLTGEIATLFSQKTPTVSVKKGQLKELVLTWPTSL